MTRFSLTFLLLAACGGDDPVNFSAPVGINLKAKSGDINNTSTISEEKGITTESGNPYAAFVTDATAKLGRAPGRIDVDSLKLVLGATSQGVVGLEEVFTGDVDVAFLTNDTNNTYDVGHVMNPTGVGPVGVAINFDDSAIAPQDNVKVLAGAFKVVLRGPAAAGFMAKNADADLQLTFTFAAFE